MGERKSISALRIVNTTGIGQDTRIFLDGVDVGAKLTVEKIEIIAGEPVRARLVCWADCDLTILPENVTVITNKEDKYGRS